MTAHLKAIRTGVFILSFIAIGLCLPLLAHAETIVVETAEDLIATNGACSLREAIGATDPANFAGTIPPFPDCSTRTTPDLDNTIIFTDAVAGATIGLTNELSIKLTGSLTISGNVPIVISGNNENRIFTISSTNVTLDSLTLTSGVAPGSGGAIDFINELETSSATLTLNQVAITNSQANGDGGAIHVAAIDGVTTLNVFNSQLSGNRAIFCDSDSDECGGNPGYGGAIYNGGGIVNISNSTLSGNTAEEIGGALANFSGGRLGIQYSTLFNNTADTVGGIYNNLSSATILSTSILANNANGDCYNEVSSGPIDLVGSGGPQDVTSQGFNLFGNDNDFTPPNSNRCQRVATDITTAPANLGVAPLADNGGDTFTHALLPNSPALDAITQGCTVATDQRGAARDALCDIGAYEFPPAGFIGDRIWFDDNGNGLQDSGEPGVPNVTVNLFSAGSLRATTATNGNGIYTFTALAPTTYIVRVITTTLPSGPTLRQTGDPDQSIDSATTLLVNNRQPITAADFGYQRLGSISGRVWDDTNGNGQLDSGELGLANVAVRIEPAINVSVTTTAPDGSYRFPLLPAGRYTVTVAPNSGALATGNYQQTADPDSTFDDQSSVVLAAGTTVTDADFGYQELSSIGDLVWIDVNANGQQESDEPGIFGVTVILWRDDGADGTPDTQVFSMTTDSNGNYQFTGINPNSVYLLEFVDPQARSFTRPNVQDESVDSDADPATGRTAPFTLPAGTDADDVDSGYLPSYQITLSPPTASRDVGSTHTVTAQVTALISAFSAPTVEPVTGIDVRFTASGVNPIDRTVSTDGNGNATFTYQYAAATNGAGRDTITGQVFLAPSLNGVGPIATAVVDWQPLSMSIERSGVWVVEGEVETRYMTATILSAATTPVAGLSVGFEVTQHNVQEPITKSTDLNGQVVFSYTSRAPTSQVQASTTTIVSQPTVHHSPATLCNSAVSGETDIITIWVDTDGNDQFNGTELFDQCEVASAITLRQFHARNHDAGAVIITWQTATELNNAGFHLHRATASAGPFIRITKQLIAAQGNGGGATYSYQDQPPGVGPFYYQLEDVDLGGKRAFHEPVLATDDLPVAEQSLRLFLPLLLR